jgi:CrcB protein
MEAPYPVRSGPKRTTVGPGAGTVAEAPLVELRLMLRTPGDAAQSPFARLRRARGAVPWSTVAVVSAGGALGAEARYGVGLAISPGAGGFPWGTLTINVSGCFLIGVLITMVEEMWPTRRLLRPFLGTGVLGGYTTFSAYIVDTQRLVDAGAGPTAIAYLLGTVAAALPAVYIGLTGTQLALTRLRRTRESRRTKESG